MKSADKSSGSPESRAPNLDSRFHRAALGEPVDRTPVWFMRQAGRYLPEYRDLRKQHTIHEICRSADLMVEATLQPIRRFEFDAAILFSDISILLEAMGVPLRLEEGKGPLFPNPLRNEADVRAFVKRSSVIPSEVEEPLSSISRAIQTLTRKLPPGIPLLGFAGSPFTLSAYMIEGGYVRDFPATREFIYRHPAAFSALLEHVTDSVIHYVRAQIECGAAGYQIFDTWAVALSPAQFQIFVLPCLKRLFKSLHTARPLVLSEKRLPPGGGGVGEGEPTSAGRRAVKPDSDSRLPTPDSRFIPGIYFAPSGSSLLPMLHQTGADVLSLDWRVSLSDVRSTVPKKSSVKALQGNLDPAALFLPKKELIKAVRAVLKDNGGHLGHIFNLGHGVLPRTPLASVETVISTVHAFHPGSKA